MWAVKGHGSFVFFLVNLHFHTSPQEEFKRSNISGPVQQHTSPLFREKITATRSVTCDTVLLGKKHCLRLHSADMTTTHGTSVDWASFLIILFFYELLNSNEHGSFSRVPTFQAKLSTVPFKFLTLLLEDPLYKIYIQLLLYANIQGRRFLIIKYIHLKLILKSYLIRWKQWLYVD